MKQIDIPKIHMEYPMDGNMKTNYKAFVELAGYFFQWADASIKKVHYISLLCRGSSGAIAATIFYSQIVEKYPHLIEVRINHVKKEGERSHSGSTGGLFEGFVRKDVLYVIVDDFSNTATTLDAIYNEVSETVGKVDFIVLKYIHKAALEKIKKDGIAKTIIAKVV